MSKNKKEEMLKDKTRADADRSHLAVVRPKTDFTPNTLEWDWFNSYYTLKGQLDGIDSEAIQLYEFPISSWSVDSAKKFLTDNGIEFTKFIPATQKGYWGDNADTKDKDYRVDLIDINGDPSDNSDFMVERFEDTAEGFLTGRAIVTNIGVFTYLLADGTIRRELRHPEDVFAQDSVDSLRNIVITNNHPGQAVDSENVNRLQVGFGGENVHEDGKYLSIPITITDKQTKQDMMDGKRALSCGYFADVEEVSGVHLGSPYDARQRNIRYNHTAVVDRARAGDAAKIKLDSAGGSAFHSIGVQKIQKIQKEDSSMPNLKKIKIDGVELEAEKEVIIAYTKSLEKNDGLNALIETAKKDHSTLEAERDTLKADNDKLKADAEKLEKEGPQKIDEAIAEGIKNRTELVSKATSADVEVKADQSDEDIKKNVILKAFPDATEKIEKADEHYIAARFDAAVEMLVKKEDDGNDADKKEKLGGTPKPSEKKDTAEEAYLENKVRLEDAWKKTSKGDK